MRKLGKIIAVLAGVISLTLAAPQSYAATALNSSSCTDANVIAGLGAMETAFAAKDITTIGNIVDTNYFNKAETRTAFMAKLTGLFAAATNVQLSYGSVVCSPKNVGTTAAAIAGEEVLGFETMTMTTGAGTSTQINYKHLFFKATNGTNGTGGWTLYGNQKNWGVHFGTGNHNDPAAPANNGTFLYVNVQDPTNLVTNVTLAGPGITGAVTLNSSGDGSTGKDWHSWGSPKIFPAVMPTLPAVYTLTITDNTGTTIKTLTYASLNANFPTALDPSGNYTASTPPVFSWTPPASGQYLYQVNLGNWGSPNIAGNSVAYNGPTLATGGCYNYVVDALDIYENIAESQGHLGMNTTTCLPTSLGGPASGAGTYTSNGTYTWDSAASSFVMNISTNNFVCNGPNLGSNPVSGVTVSATTMVWANDGMTWTRSSGVANDIVGTWTSVNNNGDTYTLTINAGGSMNLGGTITSCINVSYGTNTDSLFNHNFNINVNDPLGSIQSAVLSGGPALGTGMLVPSPNANGSGVNWQIDWTNGAAGTFNYTTFPTLPVNYTLTIIDNNGVKSTQSVSYTAFNTTFVTGLTPSTVTGTAAPIFNWTVPSGQSSSGIQLNEISPQNGAWLNNVWHNWNLNGANSATYTGTLPLPACSQVTVSANDVNNNQSTLIQYLGSNLPAGQTCGASGVTTASGYTVATGIDTQNGTWVTTVNNSSGAMSIVIRETNGKIYSLTSQLTNGAFSTTGTVSISGTVTNGAVSGSWTDSSTSTTATFSGNVVTGGGTASNTTNFDQMWISRDKTPPDTTEYYYLGLRYPRSAGDGLSSYSISCQGYTTVTGVFNAAQSSGNEWASSGMNLGSTQPTLPLNCTSTVTYTNGSTNSATATIDRLVVPTAYISAVSLAPNANVTTAPNLSWTNPATGSYTYQVHLRQVMPNGNNQEIFYVWGLTSPSVTYTGPALVANTAYEYSVDTMETVGNKIYAATTNIPFCYNCTGTSYTASGTYSLDSVNNAVTFNWTTSNFVGCDGPSVGSKIQTGLVVTATSMSWANDTMTWTRSTGTAGDIKGTWTGTDPSTGNVYTLIINADGSISGSANIVMPSSCASNGGNGGSAAKAEAQHWASGYTVQLRYSDSSQTATAVSVTGPGITNSVALIYNTAMGSWGSGNTGSQISYGTSVPTGLPYNYTFTITGASGTTPTTATSTVSCFESQFVSNISPAGTGTVTGTPTFSWTGISDSSAVYGVQVNDSNGNWVWANYNISGTSIVYNGPSLTPGANYGYVVSVQSSSACSNPTSGGGSYVAGNFTVANGAVGGSYVGTYTGTYTGTASGTWTATVAQDGTVTATVIVSLLGQVSATGHVVLSSGALTITTTGAVGAVATFTGTIDANTGGVTGTWAGFTSDSGSFVGNSANHSGSAGSNIQLQMRTDQGPGGVMGPRQHVNLDVNQIPGTVSSVSVSGPGIANSLVLTKGPARIVSGVTYDSFFGGFDPSSTITNGAVYTFTVTPVGGGAATSTTQTYTGTAVTNTTTGAITITSPTGYALTSASLGSPLAVQWTLPTAYTIAQVKMGGYVQTSALGSNSGYQCWFDGPTLSATATSGSMTLPTTCGPNNDAVVQAGINVSTIGTNGESSLIIYQFSGGGSTDAVAPSVPTNLAATPSSASQVNLSWTASTDNVGVTAYKVYRGGLLIASPTGTSYNDTGRTASTSYSYTVAACDAANNCSNQTSAVSATTSAVSGGTVTLNLIPSWNLVGNSVEAPLTVASVFGDSNKVNTVWKWLPSGQWAFYTPTQTDGGEAYALSKGYIFLTTINAGEGFWVNAKTTFTAPLPTGTAVQSSSFMPATTSPVAAGGAHALPHSWSLIATGDSPTPAQFDQYISTALANPPAQGSVYTNLTTLWAWDATNSSWYFWAPSLVNTNSLAGYLTQKSYKDFSTIPSATTGTLSPTTGFWVNMP